MFKHAFPVCEQENPGRQHAAPATHSLDEWGDLQQIVGSTFQGEASQAVNTF